MWCVGERRADEESDDGDGPVLKGVLTADQLRRDARVARHTYPRPTFGPPTTGSSDGGCESPHACIAAMEVAGASATATHLGMAFAYCGADA